MKRIGFVAFRDPCERSRITYVDVVFTTTFSGYLYPFDAATGKILLSKPLSAGTNAPVTVDGDYVVAGADVPAPDTQQQELIIAYRLGAKGTLPVTVGL